LSSSILALATTSLTRLSGPDLILVAVYLVGITLFGLRFRKGKGSAPADRSLKSYFLAGNTIPWWAISLSIVSAETSTLTIISIPGVAFAGDFGFLQIVLGYMLGRIVVASLFLPRYFAGEMLTAYQLIDRRFGRVLHKVTAALFLLTRAAAEGVRVFAVSIVVGIAIGTRDILSIAIISALTLLYTFEGGMAAVIWTDVVQMAIYVFGTLVAVWSLGAHIPGGWSTIHHVAGTAGKFRMFNFAFNLTTTYTFWAGVLGGTFLTMASHGTDQLMVQRLLAARSLRESRLALLSSGGVIFIQFALFLLIGVGLYVFYGPPLEAITTTGVWHWTAHVLPVGTDPTASSPPSSSARCRSASPVCSLQPSLPAAMSNLSAALNSLIIHNGRGLLHPASPSSRRPRARHHLQVLDGRLGAGAVRHRGLLGRRGRQRPRRGDRPQHRERGLRMPAGRLPARHTHQVRHRDRRDYRNGLRICAESLALARSFSGASRSVHDPAHRLDLVRHHRSPRDLWHRIAREPCLPQAIRATGRDSGCALAGAGRLLGCSTHRLNRRAPDFTPVSHLITDAIAAHKLPGAVVVIGHNGKVVFEQAYGDRKLAGEPGLDGKAFARRADDRRHHLRHGLAHQVPRHGDRRDAAL
jgi:hypothetical protein